MYVKILQSASPLDHYTRPRPEARYTWLHAPMKHLYHCMVNELHLLSRDLSILLTARPRLRVRIPARFKISTTSELRVIYISFIYPSDAQAPPANSILNWSVLPGLRSAPRAASGSANSLYRRRTAQRPCQCRAYLLC